MNNFLFYYGEPGMERGKPKNLVVCKIRHRLMYCRVMVIFGQLLRQSLTPLTQFQFLQIVCAKIAPHFFPIFFLPFFRAVAPSIALALSLPLHARDRSRHLTGNTGLHTTGNKGIATRTTEVEARPIRGCRGRWHHQ